MPNALNPDKTSTTSPEPSTPLSSDLGNIIYSVVDTITAMLDQNNLVKIDPAKLRAILDACKEKMSIGSGRASGKNRAILATELAL